MNEAERETSRSEPFSGSQCRLIAINYARSRRRRLNDDDSVWSITRGLISLDTLAISYEDRDANSFYGLSHRSALRGFIVCAQKSRKLAFMARFMAIEGN
jgi:hypothetical protein